MKGGRKEKREQERDQHALFVFAPSIICHGETQMFCFIP